MTGLAEMLNTALAHHQAGRLAQGFFHHGRRIDEYFDLTSPCRGQPPRERLEFFLDHVVIIVALRVDRNRAACAHLQDR